MTKVVWHEFVIGGFSQIDTGARDYGMGIVRVDPRFLAAHPLAGKWGRHALLRVRAKKQKRTTSMYAGLRSIHPADLPADQATHLLCLEYDDRLLLDVEKGEKVLIGLSKASVWGSYKYFRDHPNIVVRSYTRYTFLTGVFTGLLGAMTWALFRKLGF